MVYGFPGRGSPIWSPTDWWKRPSWTCCCPSLCYCCPSVELHTVIWRNRPVTKSATSIKKEKITYFNEKRQVTQLRITQGQNHPKDKITQRTKSPKRQNCSFSLMETKSSTQKSTTWKYLKGKMDITGGILKAGHDRSHSWAWGWPSGKGGVATSICARGAKMNRSEVWHCIVHKQARCPATLKSSGNYPGGQPAHLTD